MQRQPGMLRQIIIILPSLLTQRHAKAGLELPMKQNYRILFTAGRQFDSSQHNEIAKASPLLNHHTKSLKSVKPNQGGKITHLLTVRSRSCHLSSGV
jgi:hypothetical protein